jgi:hypothetical protein
VRVDDGRDARRRGAPGSALLDGAQRRNVELLLRRGRVAEPGVVRERDQHLGAFAHRAMGELGEHALDAEQGADAEAGGGEQERAAAGGVPRRRIAGEPGQAAVLGDGHEAVLVVASGDTAVAHHIRRVVIARAGRRRFVVRAAEDQSARRGSGDAHDGVARGGRLVQVALDR